MSLCADRNQFVGAYLALLGCGEACLPATGLRGPAPRADDRPAAGVPAGLLEEKS